jgi:arylsulfatase A-like enzyme
MKRFALLCLLSSLLLPCAAFAADGTKPNVLFIAVDDLNHWVGHLGRNPQTRTPNIDRLAKMGVTFTRANCSAPVCNPSRASLMSGLRPGQTGVYDNGQDWKSVIPREQTLTTQFLNGGYDVFGAGKIYHASAHRDGEWTDYFPEKGGDPKRFSAQAKNDGVGGIKFAPLDCNDEDMVDYKSATYGIEHLGKKHDKPFFLAIGFHKPHMPWNVPQKYYDMFPLETIQLPPTQPNDLADVPPSGVKMAKPDGDHAAMLASGRWKEAVQGYLAAIAFLDGQVGRLLDAYDASPNKANTMICFWGDHGWHLGEKEHWRKFALWEEATRTPFIWVVPGVTKAGSVCERPVDYTSIFPTLCDLAGLPIPAHAKGPLMRPLLADAKAEWSLPAITTYHQNNHSIRTEKWRYIHYANGDEELYDHDADPYEWKNLATDPKFAATKAELGKWLPKDNVAELPRTMDGEGEGGDKKMKAKGKELTPEELKAKRAAKQKAKAEAATAK